MRNILLLPLNYIKKFYYLKDGFWILQRLSAEKFLLSLSGYEFYNYCNSYIASTYLLTSIIQFHIYFLLKYSGLRLFWEKGVQEKLCGFFVLLQLYSLSIKYF